MKALLLFLLLLTGWNRFIRISEINRKTQNAAAAYYSGNFAGAVKQYEFLVYELQENNPEILLNLGHAYLRNNQADKAKVTYLKCIKGTNAGLRSVAWEKLGTLETKVQNYRQALTFYKRALVANPENEQARYNYELLKKYLKENPEKQNQIPPPQPEQNKPSDKKDPEKGAENQQNENKPDQNGEEGEQDKKDPGNQQEGRDKQNQPGREPEHEKQHRPENPGQGDQPKPLNQGTEKGNEKGLNPEADDAEPKTPNQESQGGNQPLSGNEKNLQTQYERLRQMNISPEKAEMILDAMRNAEQQYLQQLPKKATKKADRSKPDW